LIDIARILAGGSFGDGALKCGKPRLYTTKAITRCHLLVLHRDDWKATEKSIVKRKITEKVAFIKQIPIFSKLSATYLTSKLVDHFFSMVAVRDQIIFKEGDLADKIYIIREGEFAVSKKLLHKDKDQDNNI
jgi:CRP-like cAMP-binding protein